MSHQNPTESTQELSYVVKYDPAALKEARKQKNLWLAFTIGCLIAWIVAILMSSGYALVAVGLLVAPILIVSVIGSEKRNQFGKIDAKYQLVKRANALADSWQDQLEQTNAPFTVSVVTLHPGPKRRHLTVSYDDPMFAPLVFEIGETYFATVVRDGVARGPELEQVIDALEEAVQVSSGFDHSTGMIMRSARRFMVREVSEQTREAMRLSD